MKVGILKETKNPVDNRVALTPSQIKDLSERFPHIEFKVQSSPIRAYSDQEYRDLGIQVCDNVNDCDLMLGIKEAAVDTLLPSKHYIFFGHIAKKQEYNIPLFKKLLELKDTFSDYEYLVDDEGIRLVAFGWFAGIVGVYYTLMGWGMKTGLYKLPKPHLHFSMEELVDNLNKAKISGVKIVVTGSGRVSHGAQHVLRSIGAKEYTPEDFLSLKEVEGIAYCVLPVDKLVAPNEPEKNFDFKDFINHPQNYHQTFTPYAKVADILLCCHFWSNNQPVYLSEEDYLADGFNIKMIGDITCDIQGSIKSTVRSTTHSSPFYDYNPQTSKEEKAFSSKDNVTVMAVDTCPNALPRVTSEYFGEKLIEYVLNEIFANNTDHSKILDRATIVKNGVLGEYFSHLKEYVASF